MSWADFRWQFQELYPPAGLLTFIVGQRPRAVSLPSLLLPGTATVDTEGWRHPVKGTPFKFAFSFQRSINNKSNWEKELRETHYL